MKKAIWLLLVLSIIILLLTSSGYRANTFSNSKPIQAVKTFPINFKLSNGSCFSYYAEDNNNIYYAADDGIKKVDKRTKKTSLISNIQGENLFVNNNYIFFISGNTTIVKMSTNGSNQENIFDCSDFSTQISKYGKSQNGIFSYLLSGKKLFVDVENNLFEYDMQSKVLTHLVNSVADYEILNSSLYFTNLGYPVLNRLDLTTMQSKSVYSWEPWGSYCKLNNNIYIINDNPAAIYRLNGETLTKIYNGSNEVFENTVYNNNIYFTSFDNGYVLNKFDPVSCKSKKVVALEGDCRFSDICIANGYVYYSSESFGDNVGGTEDVRKTSLNPADNKNPANMHEPVKDYHYAIKDGYIVITKYYGDDKNPVIPETIDGKSVKTIGEESFYQQTDMASVSIPQSVTSIEDGTFYRCYSLEKITISKNIEQIGENPFFRCTSLTRISVDPENKSFSELDGVFYNKDKSVLLVYPEGKTNKSFTIPNSVKKIDGSAFGYHCNKLKTIIIPSNVVDFPDDNMFIYPDQITLKVKAGSVAEQYAKSNELKYEIY